MAERKVTFGRIFWPSLWAALIVSILGLIIWLIVISAFVGSFDNSSSLKLEDGTVLHMKLEGKIAERGSTSFNPGTFQVDRKLGLSDILYGLEHAKTDKKIKGVFIELDALSCGYASAREIRNAINDFEESGKFVVAYNSGEVVTQKEFYVTSAVNETYGFPSSNLAFLGLGAELTFFKKALDKLDVEIQIIRGSDNHFKSAVEPFFRESMSDSSRVQIERYINSIWDDVCDEIAKDRGITREKLNEIADGALVQDVTDAVKYKLIDEVKYRDEVMDIIAKKVGEKDGNDVELYSFAKYAKKRFEQNQVLIEGDNPNIAVILAEGGVSRSGDGLTSEEICELFKDARNNESIKTVVFRVNSPGGSALASDEIWREVKLTNAKKTVIVSMGDLAASGGYYISAPATTIFAEPTTITGSIGVFGMIPYTGDMLQNHLGLTFDRAATNKHSILTTNKRLTEEEMKMIQDGVDDIYDDFKEVVANGRGMTKEAVNQVGRGRVWTGRDALEIGLVDKLGGLKDAIDYAAKKSGISDQKVLYYPIVKEDKFGEILEQLENDASVSVDASGVKLPAELIEHYKTLKSLESYQGIQMRMPYTINVE